MNLFRKSPWIRRFCFAVALSFSFLIPATMLAQDSSSSGSSQSSSSQAGSSQQTPSDVKPAGRTGTAISSISDSDGTDQIPATSETPPIQELGRGGWLGPHDKTLHWGALYVGSLSVTGSEDHFTSTNPGALVGTVYSSSFQTSLVYNPQLPRTNLALQWHPQLGFVNGKFADNLDNQDVSFDVSSSLTPRLNMRFQDHFSSSPVQSVFGNAFLFGSQSIGNRPYQGTFLDGPGRWLTDTGTVSFGYGLSPTSSLTFTPSFNYSRQTGTAVNGVQASPLQGSNEYSGTVRWDRKLSLLKSFGLFYNFSALKFKTINSYVQYHTLGVGYSQQLRPSLFINISVGASDIRNPNDVAANWTTSASVDLEKRFQFSSATLAYSRGLSLDQYASRSMTDRVDFAYTQQLFSRLSAAVGGGYQRVNGPPVISGKYGTAQLTYRLFSNLSALASYVYKFQVGDAVQIFTETRHSAYITLSWDPLHKHQ